jgi:predicted porin
MKKSLIALAVAGAFAAPAAMAEVTLSGAINLGIEIGKTDEGTAPGGESLTTTSLNSNYSHVDLESVDDIGDGNKIIFHYQLNATPQTTNGGGNNRNSFLGIAGTWGAFKMGTNENVYERFMYTADPLDGAVGPGGNLNILATPGIGQVFDVGQSNCGSGTGTSGCTGFYRRTDQTIWYESPNWSGFSFEVDYTLSAFKSNTPDVNPTIISVGGKYAPEGQPWYIDLAFEQHTDMFGLNQIGNFYGSPVTGATGSTDTAAQIGGGWQFGDLGIHLRYEQLKYKADGVTSAFDEYKRTATWFGAKYNLPSGYIGGEVGVAGDGEANDGSVTFDDTGATMIGIGYFHNLSKQSQLQFIASQTNNKDNAAYAGIGSPNGGQIGADHTVFHVGLKHTF